MTEQIIEYIVMIAPSLAAIIVCVLQASKVLRSFVSLKTSVDDKTSLKELRGALEASLSEVNNLKKLLIKELETKTRVKENPDEYESKNQKG